MTDTTDLTSLWVLEDLGADAYIAKPPGNGFLFGGQTMALMLKAAGQTVADPLVPKSVHFTFVRAGQWGPKLELQVTRVNDSRSFAHRTVSMFQHGKLLAMATASFHGADAGSDHHVPAPEGPGPDGLPTIGMRLMATPPPVELRLVSGADDFLPTDGKLHPYWARPVGTVGSGLEADCATTFVSDYMVVTTPFGSPRPEGLTVVTLTHTIWFHRGVPGDAWLRYDADTQSVVDGRFLSSGRVHAEDGALVASFVQEGLIRQTQP